MRKETPGKRTEKSVKKTTQNKKKNSEIISLIFLLICCVILIILISQNFLGEGISKMVKQENHSYSDFIDTKEIATLSVSKFVYNGIAQALKDDGEIDYNVLYKSTVKVSVDANAINYSVDEEQKLITFIFPKFSIENPVVDVGSVSLIPNKKNLEMKDVISLCRNDAMEEAKKSDKLISSAQENLKSIIEAWYSPVLPEYSFEFIFTTTEGGEAN